MGVIDTPDKLRQSPGLIISEVLDELVIYAPGSSQAISLNASARAIWELCDGTRTLDDLCVELSGAAGLASDQLHEDVSGAITRLHELGLIKRDSP